MGEFELLAKLRERLPPAAARVRLGSGDDAAVTVPGGATATSVDASVDGVHFRRDRAELEQIGHKALATALSDLAAMGAEAGEAYVVLGVPPDLGEEECLRIVDGMTALAAATGTTLAGGDLTRAPALTLAVTVVGHAETPERFISRAGARPGDALALSGELGGAAAGLLLLERPELAAAVPDSTAAALRRRQLEPQPRLRGRACPGGGGRDGDDRPQRRPRRRRRTPRRGQRRGLADRGGGAAAGRGGGRGRPRRRPRSAAAGLRRW